MDTGIGDFNAAVLPSPTFSSILPEALLLQPRIFYDCLDPFWEPDNH